MSRWTTVVIGLGVVGVGFALLATVLPGRLAETGGMATFGVAGIAAAIGGFTTRRQVALRPEARYARYEGVAALWGSVWMLLLGVTLVIVAACWITRSERQLFELVRARPSLALLPFGLSTLSGGMANWLGWRLTKHPDAPLVRSRFGGPAAVLGGALLMAVGAVELVNPAGFDLMLAAIVRSVAARASGGSGA